MQTSALQVTIKRLRADKGKVLFAVYNSKSGFPEDAKKAVDKAAVAIQNVKTYCHQY
jgi:uncharacterized protein (DUF2141 family)